MAANMVQGTEEKARFTHLHPERSVYTFSKHRRHDGCANSSEPMGSKQGVACGAEWKATLLLANDNELCWVCYRS